MRLIVERGKLQRTVVAKHAELQMKAINPVGFWLILLACLLGACSTATERIERRAARMDLVPLVLEGGGFPLRAFYGAGAQPGTVLHVYLEGDGADWRKVKVYDPTIQCTKEIAESCSPTRVVYKIPDDPTPRRPLMLSLMEQDHSARLYLGRPCYFGFAAMPPCNPDLWTLGRYSPLVITAMAEALERFLAEHSYQKIVWLGHSGGGTLAMLLATRFPQSVAVVTLAGNLNVVGWAKHHNFTPLSRSLDPAREPPLPAHIRQRHYVGALDTVIPAELVAEAVAAQPGAQLEVLPEVGHQRGWPPYWPAILAFLETLDPVPSGPAPAPEALRVND